MKLEEALTHIKKDRHFRVQFTWTNTKKQDYFPDSDEKPFQTYDLAVSHGKLFRDSTRGKTEKLGIICSNTKEMIGDWYIEFNHAVTMR